MIVAFIGFSFEERNAPFIASISDKINQATRKPSNPETWTTKTQQPGNQANPKTQ